MSFRLQKVTAIRCLMSTKLASLLKILIVCRYPKSTEIESLGSFRRGLLVFLLYTRTS